MQYFNTAPTFADVQAMVVAGTYPCAPTRPVLDSIKPGDQITCVYHDSNTPSTVRLDVVTVDTDAADHTYIIATATEQTYHGMYDTTRMHTPKVEDPVAFIGRSFLVRPSQVALLMSKEDRK